MPLPWRHSPTECEAVEKNIRKLSKKKLSEIYGEIESYKVAQIPDEDGCIGVFDEDAYQVALKKARADARENLADEVWKYVQELRTCDNGGHNAWVCPHGCHTVKFE